MEDIRNHYIVTNTDHYRFMLDGLVGNWTLNLFARQKHFLIIAHFVQLCGQPI